VCLLLRPVVSQDHQVLDPVIAAARSAALLYLRSQAGEPGWAKQDCIRIGVFEGGVQAAMKMLKKYGDEPEILATCLVFLRMLARSNVCKESITGHDGLAVIVQALKRVRGLRALQGSPEEWIGNSPRYRCDSQ
jgi:hypothetical protein